MKDLVRPLSEKRRFRTPSESQHVKGSKTFVKSAGERFYHIFWLLWGKIILKLSPLVICETLGVFVNILMPRKVSSPDLWGFVAPNSNAVI